MVADQEKPAADPKAAEASKIIRNHAIAAVATCLIPIPFVGVGLLAGAHLRMISQLARLYEVEFSEQRAKSIIGSLMGISATGAALSLLRLSPALGLLGALTLPSASTYALGKVFTEHFESGGTFLTFDPEKARALYDKALTEKAAEEESYEGVKP
jgi:uncharacterized protein (DUF697 family)